MLFFKIYTIYLNLSTISKPRIFQIPHPLQQEKCDEELRKLDFTYNKARLRIAIYHNKQCRDLYNDDIKIGI